MKKSKFRKKLKAIFWVVVALGFLWAFFAPHTRVTPPTVTVKVQRPIKPKDGELLPAPPPAPEPELKPPFEEPQQSSGITVPVAPEPPPEPLPDGRGVKIAIVIDDMGADIRTSEKAIRLPAAITLSFLPYAGRTREQIKEARAGNHEILLHMPMEPVGPQNPGPGALLTELPMPELKERLEKALASVTGYDGINNHMGSKFTAYRAGMEMVAENLKERNLFFLDSRTNGQTVAIKIAKEKGLPSISRDVFLDDVPTLEAVRKQLELTERIARRKGRAVAIGHPHQATIEAIRIWVPEAQSRGIELVPVNELVNGQ
ncbi:MAG: divergent polysaccharide deacetylase family protein [Alphaproteobacteria bacterium]|nr:divergent polysaccharide deacetylase family protein [Alphaproteobacteria bacterium]